MDDKVIIDLFVEKINKGEMTLEQVPIGWKAKVAEYLDSKEG